MADNKKISQLSIVNSWTNLKSTDIIPLVASNTTSQVSLDKLVTYITQWSAKTGSNTFIGDQSINGSLTVSNDLLVNGTLTVKKMMVDVTSASVIYQDGSTKFGDTINDTHEYTGSLKVSGSISLLGANIGTILYNYTSSTNAIHTYTSSLKSSISVSGTDTQIIGNLTSSNFRVTGNSVLNTVSANATTINGSLIATAGITGSVSGGIVQDGNSFGYDMIIGTNDNYGLGLETNGTRRLVIGTNGNVGIGTLPTTATRLHISASSARSLLLQSYTSTGSNYVEFWDSTGVRTSYIGHGGSNNDFIYYLTGSANSHTFYTGNNTTQLKIAGDGVVSITNTLGVGTTAPSAKLHIATGSQTILIGTGSNTSAYTFSIGANDDGVNFSNNSADRGYNFNNANGTHLKIDSAGNTGIGTITPGAKLDISGSVRIQNTGQLKLSGSVNSLIAGGDNSFVKISGGSSPSNSNGAGAYFSGNTESNTGRLQLWSGNVAGNHIRLDTSGTERVRIDNTGNVGVATTTPTAKLDILSNSTASLRIKSADATNSYIEFGIDTNGGRAIINSGNSGGTTRKISFRTDDTPRMTIDTTGNVGIGTESPTDALHVIGNSRFDGGLRYALRVLTANTTLTTSDTYIIGNGAITLTMPSATTAGAGFTLYIKNIHASSNVTVSRAGTDTFDGSSTTVTINPASSTTLVSNGSNTWYILFA